MNIQPATRSGIVPTIGLYSESGNGKTYSALLLARGMAGPSGNVVMVDTEGGRGRLYADVIPGGYNYMEIANNFPPSAYIEALDAVEQNGAAVGIVDSCSHEWEGPGGVLDSASASEEKSGKPGLHNWRKPKLAHALFVQRLMRCRIPIILCIRAKFKTRQGKDEKGRTVIIKDDHVSPIQADDFLFELTAHGEILPDHSLRLTKWSHPALKACFPDGAPITTAHGEAVAKWCAAGGPVNGPSTTTVDPAVAATKALAKELWVLLKPVRGTENNWTAANQWLWKNDILDGGVPEEAPHLTPEKFRHAIEAAKKVLGS